jgi:hypothetical protein
MSVSRRDWIWFVVRELGEKVESWGLDNEILKSKAFTTKDTKGHKVESKSKADAPVISHLRVGLRRVEALRATEHPVIAELEHSGANCGPPAHRPGPNGGPRNSRVEGNYSTSMTTRVMSSCCGTESGLDRCSSAKSD